jgi:hypothetical protein
MPHLTREARKHLTVRGWTPNRLGPRVRTLDKPIASPLDGAVAGAQARDAGQPITFVNGGRTARVFA